MSDAYAGTGTLASGTSEWNRLDFAMRSIVNKMATATLVQVKAVRAGSVDVQPMVHQLDGAKNAVPHGVIHNLPVWRYQAGGNAVIMDPVVGDIGLAVFAHSDISSAKANKAPSNPGSFRKFDWADGIYLGGVLNAEPTQWVKFLPNGGVELVATAQVKMTTSGTVLLDAGLVSTTHTLAAGNGATGTFTSQDGKVVTVANGIVTRIV